LVNQTTILLITMLRFRFTPVRLLAGSIFVISLLALSSCKTVGPQDIGETPGPDPIEMGKQAEIKAEIEKVFGPVDEKSELLHP